MINEKHYLLLATHKDEEVKLRSKQSCYNVTSPQHTCSVLPGLGVALFRVASEMLSRNFCLTLADSTVFSVNCDNSGFNTYGAFKIERKSGGRYSGADCFLNKFLA